MYKRVDNVDNYCGALKIKVSCDVHKFFTKCGKIFAFSSILGTKNHPQSFRKQRGWLTQLFSKKMLADIYNISGPHGNQQIAVRTVL